MLKPIFHSHKNYFKKVDILFLQETWLFNFQLPLLQEYFSSHLSFGKAVDDENPLPSTQKPRGYRGVACIVRRDLDIKYKFHLNDGSDHDFRSTN